MSDLNIDLFFPVNLGLSPTPAPTMYQDKQVQVQPLNVSRCFPRPLLDKLFTDYLNCRDILSMGCVASFFKNYLNEPNRNPNLTAELLTFMGLNPIHTGQIDLEWYENNYCGPSFNDQSPAPTALQTEISRTLIIDNFIARNLYPSDRKITALFQSHILNINNVTLQIENSYETAAAITEGFFDLLNIFFNLPLESEIVINIESLSLRCKQFMIAFERMNKSPHSITSTSIADAFRNCIQLQIDMIESLPTDDNTNSDTLKNTLKSARNFCMAVPANYRYYSYQVNLSSRNLMPSKEGFYIYHDFITENKGAIKTHCWSNRSHTLIIPELIPCSKEVESVSFRFNGIVFLSPNFAEKFPSLKELDLTANLLGPGSILVISRLTKLETLDLRQNKHLTWIGPEIGLLTNLRELHLCHSGLESLPREIGLLTNLETLDIRGNPFKTLPIEVFKLPKLQKFKRPNGPDIQII